jgi:hypothetical protein
MKYLKAACLLLFALAVLASPVAQVHKTIAPQTARDLSGGSLPPW